MLWILGIVVILVLGFTVHEYKKRERLMNEIEASAERIEKLAKESQEITDKILKK